MAREREFSKIDSKIDKLKNKIKGLEDLKVSDTVFDRFTLLTLYDIVNRGYFEVLYGAVKTGKESNVFLAKDSDGQRLAVKIHRMVTSDFHAMIKYIEGDRRFSKIKKSRRSTILTWVEKEFQNMRTAYDAGVNVPRPIYSKKNVVVMEFIGEGDFAAPTLKAAKAAGDELFSQVAEDMRILFKAGLVHGDLSEYNILLDGDKAVIIDLSQSVPLDHPLAEELLERDVRNVCRHFNKKFDKLYNSIIS
ncbi:bifunctional UGMP family protein/serine/threonine protein kinase [archaeon BMS3Abin16]|nr:bifunctional UGMP family protein/serine/threonine protein kinase [archaeon BMS3Abin16]GBE56601.1 bifunctional UGMP family protein/serine/threonine protein kinase [archaeon BMS3Bbin16]